MKSVGIALLAAALLVSVSGQVSCSPSRITNSDFIRVDQFGYLPNSAKVAVIANPKVGYDADAGLSFAPSVGSSQYQLRRWSDDKVVFSGTLTPWNGGATDDLSGDQAWWFDFSSVKTSGSYYVYDVGRNVRSFKVNIGPDVYADELRAALRMFFYQRCNTRKDAKYVGVNWADGPSFVGPGQDKEARSALDPTNPAIAKELSGGWWDAGDLNKYTTNTSDAVNLLLIAYTETPSVFGDNNNIPESGNGIPDILDEVKWGVDWLKKMQLEDGSALRKMGTLRDYSGPKATLPPSTDTRPRYYLPAVTSSTIAVAGVFARASVVFRKIPKYAAYADDLKARAIRAFHYAETHPLVQDKTGLIEGGNGDWSVEKQAREAVHSAVYMYEATGNAAYKDYVEKNFMLLDESVRSGRPYEPGLTVCLLEFAKMPDVSPAVSDRIRSTYRASLNITEFYGWSDKDPYRAYMPKITYHWASMSTRSNVGGRNREAILSGVDPMHNASYLKRSEEMLHYINGVNPFNMVYLTNMYAYGVGKSADEIFHLWYADGSDWDNARTSKKGGPPPGYLPGGPNKNWKPSDSAFSHLAPPANQPPQKAYRSWNGTYPNQSKESSWTVTEPSIQYQCGYIWLLSKYATKTAKPLPMPVAGPVVTVNQ